MDHAARLPGLAGGDFGDAGQNLCTGGLVAGGAGAVEHDQPVRFLRQRCQQQLLVGLAACQGLGRTRFRARGAFVAAGGDGTDHRRQAADLVQHAVTRAGCLDLGTVADGEQGQGGLAGAQAMQFLQAVLEFVDQGLGARALVKQLAQAQGVGLHVLEEMVRPGGQVDGPADRRQRLLVPGRAPAQDDQLRRLFGKQSGIGFEQAATAGRRGLAGRLQVGRADAVGDDRGLAAQGLDDVQAAQVVDGQARRGSRGRLAGAGSRGLGRGLRGGAGIGRPGLAGGQGQAGQGAEQEGVDQGSVHGGCSRQGRDGQEYPAPAAGRRCRVLAGRHPVSGARAGWKG